ncbi:MAG: hypothetical protein K6G22_12810 [Lachnospiraceae bacterium]|nr:hypothetical protein [Lachnospiraceae bacterium]
MERMNQYFEPMVQHQIGGYSFKNHLLLEQAFTRRSYSEENGGENNEALEFIGDKVLDLAVIRYLVAKNGCFISAESGCFSPTQNGYFFPTPVIFLAAVIFSFSTGTSWGSFGILIPIVTAIFSADDPLLIIGVSACPTRLPWRGSVLLFIFRP